MNDASSLCLVTPCAESPKARGMCRPHYEAWRRSAAGPCQAEGCLNRVSRRGLCRRHGTEVPWVRPASLSRDPQPCPAPGCEKPVAWGGLCSGHKARRFKYGLSPEDFDRMLAAQDGRCAICGVTQEASKYPLVVDHDHRCCAGRSVTCGECIRGILCKGCNVGIGNLRDDPDVLLAAVRYLSR